MARQFFHTPIARAAYRGMAIIEAMSHEDRRLSERYDLSSAVTMHVGGGGRTILGRTTNVSRTGVFVMTQERISEGQRVELMMVPEDGEAIFVTGVVMHTVPDYGVGVRFSALSVRADGRLMQLLERLQAAAA